MLVAVRFFGRLLTYYDIGVGDIMNFYNVFSFEFRSNYFGGLLSLIWL